MFRRVVLGAGDVDAQLTNLTEVAHVVTEQFDVLRGTLHDVNLKGAAEARFERGPGQPPTTSNGQISTTKEITEKRMSVENTH